MLTRRGLLKALPLAPLIVPATQAAAASRTVQIRAMQFTPENLEIGIGTKVTFTNSDAQAHTATSSGGLWDTGPLAPGKSTTITFNEAGIFDYYCRWHPSMKGRIIVA